MRSMRQRLAAVTLLGGLTTLGIGLSAGPASANIVDCTGFLGNAQSGSLHMTSTPAGGSIVPVGSDLALSPSWNAADFDEIGRLYVCGSVNGGYNATMSSEDKSVDNSGSALASSTVPSSVPVGANVCVVSVLVGQSPTHTDLTMTSETLCYTSAAVTTTTTTTTEQVIPRVDPVNTDAGTTSAPAVEPAPSVGGEVAVAPAPLPELPRTGSGINVLAGFGGAALALGGLTRFMGRRRPAEG
jgi:LPXTG-motif cell wall-anchored protein